MSARKLTPEEIEQAVDTLTAWSLSGGKLRRELAFRDFSEAFGFMTRVALLAESMEHHPEWWNVYNRVTIELTTHDVSGISDRDLEMANKIDSLIA